MTDKEVSLNYMLADLDIIPKAPYYYYNGSFTRTNGNMFVFDLYDGITINRSEFAKVKNKLKTGNTINKLDSEYQRQDRDIKVLKNKIGTTLLNDNKNKLITCTPIIDTGQGFIDLKLQDGLKEEEKEDDSGILPGLDKETRDKIFLWFLILLSTIIGILLIYVLYKMFISSVKSIGGGSETGNG